MRLNIFGGITKRTELKTLKKLNGILNLYLRRTKMIKIENVEIFGWQAAIRGMRNPLNSWEKSDSFESEIGGTEKWLPAKNANIIQTKPAIILNHHAANGTVIPIGTVLMPNPIIITAAIIADTLRAAMLVAIQKIIVEIIGISSELAQNWF